MEGVILLIHGGLYEAMSAQRFWGDPGIAGELAAREYRVCAPDRITHPRSWLEDATSVANDVPRSPRCHIVAGSNGCSVAVRLALDCDVTVASVTLSWPATAGVREIDTRLEQQMRDRGVPQTVVSNMLSGDTLRGVSDSELGRLEVPMMLLPCEPPDTAHQRVTLDRLHAVAGSAVIGTGYPLPVTTSFSNQLRAYCDELEEFIQTHR